MCLGSRCLSNRCLVGRCLSQRCLSYRYFVSGSLRNRRLVGRCLSHRWFSNRCLAGTSREDRWVDLCLGLECAGEAGGLRQRGVEQGDRVLKRCDHRARELSQENLTGFQIGDLADLGRGQWLTVQHTALDDQG